MPQKHTQHEEYPPDDLESIMSALLVRVREAIFFLRCSNQPRAMTLRRMTRTSQNLSLMEEGEDDHTYDRATPITFLCQKSLRMVDGKSVGVNVKVLSYDINNLSTIIKIELHTSLYIYSVTSLKSQETHGIDP